MLSKQSKGNLYLAFSVRFTKLQADHQARFQVILTSLLNVEFLSRIKDKPMSDTEMGKQVLAYSLGVLSQTLHFLLL